MDWSFVPALAAAAIGWYLGARRISIENVTQERAKWRAQIRDLSAELALELPPPAQALEKLRTRLAHSLNPFDTEDQDLLRCVGRLTGYDSPESRKELVDRVALLLKHDWDRAKREASLFSFFRPEPRRVPYAEYVASHVQGMAPAWLSPQRPSPMWLYFAGLLLASGGIFFLAVGLKDEFEWLVKYFNAPGVSRPCGEWLMFTVQALGFGAIWGVLWLVFKGCEKRFLDAWFAGGPRR